MYPTTVMSFLHNGSSLKYTKIMCISKEKERKKERREREIEREK